MDPSVSCKQRQRTRILPPSAMLDLNAYKESNVFIDSIGGSDCYCANITLTKRPTAKESKFATKADKNLEKTRPKTTPDASVTEEWQLYRLTIDLCLCNKATQNDVTICLPTLQSIESSFEGCHVSTLDLSNQFYSVELDEASRKYFNFYVVDSVWTHKMLPQGWSASPAIARRMARNGHNI